MSFSTSLYSDHAEKYNYGVVDRFVGHGVGTVFQSEPVIYHHSKYFACLAFHTPKDIRMIILLALSVLIINKSKLCSYIILVL